MMALGTIEISWLSETALAVLADAALKATIVLVIAGVLSLALRRASSAARHAVWIAAVVGALALPALALALPAWHVSFVAPAPVEPAPMPVEPIEFEPITAPPVIDAMTTEPVAPVLPWQAGVLAVWLMGVGFVLARACVAGWRVRAVVADATPVSDGAWVEALARAADRLGLADRVRLRVRLVSSGRVASPATWGVRSPVLLLPESSAEWTAERRDAVLLHELAHVRRRDCATQLAAELARAVYWFNPLAWIAAGALRTEREHAADDCVLGAGVRASEYASLLVDVARVAPVPLPIPAASFASARRSHLERRVRSILDPSRPRRPVGRVAALVAVLLATVAVAPLAASRPSIAATEAPDDAIEAATAEPSAAPYDGRPAEAPVAADERPRPVRQTAEPTPVAAQSERDHAPMPTPMPTPTPTPMPAPAADIEQDLADEAVTPIPVANEDEAEVVAALRLALKDDDEGVRKQAAWALNMMLMQRGRGPRVRPKVRPQVRPKPVVETEFPEADSDNH